MFACVWAFGGCMLVDKVYDYRTQFSKWWVSEWKNVQVRRGRRGGCCCARMHGLLLCAMRLTTACKPCKH